MYSLVSLLLLGDDTSIDDLRLMTSIVLLQLSIKKTCNFQSKLSFTRSIGKNSHENKNVLPEPALLSTNVSETVPIDLLDNGSFLTR